MIEKEINKNTILSRPREGVTHETSREMKIKCVRKSEREKKEVGENENVCESDAEKTNNHKSGK